MSEFGNLPRNHFAAIYADPPWAFKAWAKDKMLKDGTSPRAVERHYPVHETSVIADLPIGELAAHDSCLFMWFSWPMLPDAMALIEAWGFTYKTCAFCWVKGDARQVEFFNGETKADMTLGYWTRANSEACLLATRGKPKRLDAGVRQGIIEPRREHSRKPDCVYSRIERLVAGPYLELFARSTRPGWSSWGNQVGKFGTVAMNEANTESTPSKLGEWTPRKVAAE